MTATPINFRDLERDLKAVISHSEAVKAVAIVKKHLQHAEQPAAPQVPA